MEITMISNEDDHDKADAGDDEANAGGQVR